MRWWLLVVLVLACKDNKPSPAPASPAKAPPADARATETPQPLGQALPGAIGSGKLGTAHRVVRAVADPKARWAVLCQQRKDTDGNGTITFEQAAHFALGDDPSPYFVVGGGDGVELDEVIAVAASGDLLVVERDKRELLIDIAKQTVTPLGEHIQRASFTRDGTYLVYAEGTQGNVRIVRRELATGARTEVALPAKESFVVTLLPDREARWVQVVLEASSFESRDPFEDWCDLHSSRGDDANRWLWIDMKTGSTETDPTLIRVLGDHRLTRDGIRLALDGKPIGPETCDERDVLGVFEPASGVVSLCLIKEPLTFTISYNAPALPPHSGVGWVKRRWFTPFPPVLTRPTYCYQGQPGACIDLATGTTGPSKYEPDDPYPQRTDRVREVVLADEQVLVGPLDENGPLSWEPRRKN